MDEGTDRNEGMRVSGMAAWREAPMSMFVATVGGLGHLPIAPGTWGTLAALPVLVVCADLPAVWRISGLALAVVISIPTATRAGRALAAPDDDRIVVDEFVGMAATLVWFSDQVWLELLVGFTAFRFFDVLKPPGANWLHAHRDDGAGVIGDDLLAALWSAPLVALLHWFLP